uniref:hypothetical protein n=1 Tax=Flavobacterium sp. TaxID=239 RepID=UPI00404B54B1
MKTQFLIIVMLFTAFGMSNANAQTKTKVETIELKTSNPDIIVKVTRDGKILETKAYNNSSKSYAVDFSIKATLKSKTKTFTKTLAGHSTNQMFPLQPNGSTLSKSELLASADDEVKYIDGTQIKAPQDQSLYNALKSAELVTFSAKEIK